MNSAVSSARDLLADVTPLKRDCGRLCDCACCKGDEQTGMLLFPGEDALFAGCAFGRVIPANFDLAGHPAQLFVCGGSCDRDARPLACRLFPLFLRFGKAKTKIVTDPRAAAVCPLTDYGLEALDPAFTDAARRAYDLLLDDPDCAAFLRALHEAFSL